MNRAARYLLPILSAWSVELAAVALVGGCWVIASVLFSLEIAL